MPCVASLCALQSQLRFALASLVVPSKREAQGCWQFGRLFCAGQAPFFKTQKHNMGSQIKQHYVEAHAAWLRHKWVGLLGRAAAQKFGEGNHRSPHKRCPKNIRGRKKHAPKADIQLQLAPLEIRKLKLLTHARHSMGDPRSPRKQVPFQAGRGPRRRCEESAISRFCARGGGKWKPLL